MFDTCTLAVFAEMKSSAAICWLPRPAATPGDKTSDPARRVINAQNAPHLDGQRSDRPPSGIRP